jgi:hypothetical protein
MIPPERPPLFRYENFEDRVQRLAAGAFVGAAIVVVLFNISLPASGFAGLLAVFIPEADLMFHELGHMVIGMFGISLFLGVAGGTIGQLAAPASIMVMAVVRRSVVFFWLGLAWIGYNLLSIGEYMADANVRVLPLFDVGGLSNEVNQALDPSTPHVLIHDWNYMFGQLRLLWAAEIIGHSVYVLGIALMLAACWSLVAAPEDRIRRLWRSRSK